MILAPSLLSANFSCLAEEITEMESFGCKWFHIDVMDGHFVPNITFGPVILESIRSKTESILDCHLMVNDPLKFIPWFVKAGADFITFHFEATNDPKLVIDTIKKFGLKCGISIKPKTQVQVIESLLPLLDLVLVMSVEPGFGGQSFMPESLEKLKWLKNKKNSLNLKYYIEVDGGINTITAEACKNAGAEVFVAGSAIFNSKNRSLSYQEIMKAIV